MKKPFFVLEYLLYISMLLQEGTSGYSAALYTRTPVNWTELLTNEMQTKHRDSQKKVVCNCEFRKGDKHSDVYVQCTGIFVFTLPI